MSILMAMLLGLLNGVTAFFPISASGHQAILQNLFGLEAPAEKRAFFDLLMSISTLVSISMAYRRELSAVIREGSDFLRGNAPDDPMREGRLSPPLRLVYYVVIGTLPLVLTLPFGGRLGILMGNMTFTGLMMLVTGVLLLASDKLIRGGGRVNEKTMTGKDALIIGVAQAFAAIPGMARTGTTVTVGLSRGLSREYAVRYAVFLSLPSVIASIVISFFSIFRSGVDWPSFFGYLLAFVISIFSGYVALQLLRIITARKKLRYFSYYVWVVGAAAVVASFIV